MPIFEYKCKKCENVFEIYFKNLAHDDSITCPNCHSGDIERKLSTFSSFAEGKPVTTSSCSPKSKFFR